MRNQRDSTRVVLTAHGSVTYKTKWEITGAHVNCGDCSCSCSLPAHSVLFLYLVPVGKCLLSVEVKAHVVLGDSNQALTSAFGCVLQHDETFKGVSETQTGLVELKWLVWLHECRKTRAGTTDVASWKHCQCLKNQTKRFLPSSWLFHFLSSVTSFSTFLFLFLLFSFVLPFLSLYSFCGSKLKSCQIENNCSDKSVTQTTKWNYRKLHSNQGFSCVTWI